MDADRYRIHGFTGHLSYLFEIQSFDEPEIDRFAIFVGELLHHVDDKTYLALLFARRLDAYEE